MFACEIVKPYRIVNPTANAVCFKACFDIIANPFIFFIGLSTINFHLLLRFSQGTEERLLHTCKDSQ